MQTKLAITGGTGLLGSQLVHFFSQHPDYALFAQFHRKEPPLYDHSVHWDGIDLTDRDKVQAWIERVQPDLLIHTAAITQVDKMQQEKNLVKENDSMTENLVSVLPSTCSFIYISTDSVFKGDRAGYAWKETDDPDPVNEYAKSKWRGEQCVQTFRGAWMILRTSIFGVHLFYPDGGKSFNGVMDHLRKGKIYQGWTDVYSNLLSTNTLASCLARLIKKRFQGILHLGSIDRVSRYEFACHVARSYGYTDKDLEKLIRPSSLVDAACPAPRPRYPVLDIQQATRLLGVFPSVQEGIHLAIVDDAKVREGVT